MNTDLGTPLPWWVRAILWVLVKPVELIELIDTWHHERTLSPEAKHLLKHGTEDAQNGRVQTYIPEDFE